MKVTCLLEISCRPEVSVAVDIGHKRDQVGTKHWRPMRFEKRGHFRGGSRISMRGVLS
jgi:hypothetical protein